MQRHNNFNIGSVAGDVFEGDKVGGNKIDNRGGNIGKIAGRDFIENHDSNFDVEQFAVEVAKAVDEIKKSTAMTKEQQSALIELLLEANASVKNNTLEAEEVVRSKYKQAMRFMGDAGVKFVSMLSSLANLARFFGLSAQ